MPDPRFKAATASLPGYTSSSSSPSPSTTTTTTTTTTTSTSSSAMPDPAAASPSSPPAYTRPHGGARGARHPSIPQSTTAAPASSAKIVDQFDGMQIMQADLPPIHGPVSFVGRGRDRYDYITYSTLTPLDPCYGLPGFARFGMRKEYIQSDSDSGSDDGEGVVWEYNGVYIPGPKIMLGRWRDGSDPSTTNAVEGPFMFFAEL
ncbi:hypothetical protein BZA70DRAFT_275696 [Myxozyma melibiosi]|uniref:Uncharacterized protein n=1 Tax=Myxozyma melibiosi TaxID=54550 RepID=A0ABR1F8C7_9ASCO